MKIAPWFWLVASLLSAEIACAELRSHTTVDEVLAAKQDLWGIEAMKQTNGASYEFMANLLPPLRYVNAKFRHYPITLGAPGALHKARLVSNGSAINARAQLSTWKEVGVPVSFFVGDESAPYGDKLEALDGPKYERGYLPIVQMEYRANDATYRQETFASIKSPLAENAVVYTRFQLSEGKIGRVSAHVQAEKPLRLAGQSLVNDKDLTVIWFSQEWEWDAAKQTLTVRLSKKAKPFLAVATVPVSTAGSTPLAESDFDSQKKKCAALWESALSRAMKVETPENVVNNAAKATIVGTFLMRRGDDMNYSVGNAYETMYEAESGDGVRALMMWGLNKDARQLIPPLLDYGVNPGLKFHDAAFKLQMLAHYYWLTRDASFIHAERTRWLRCVKILLSERDPSVGLLPRESYCGDEGDKVFSLNSNANAWRGLHDIAVVLEQIGEHAEARPILDAAETLRKALLAAVDKSERREVQPPFLPIALFGEEKPYDVLTSTRRGSYWNLIIPYVIGSDIFGGTEREPSMMRYLEEHGGISMGLIRFHQHSGLFANEDGLDDLYTLRYFDMLLQRDEVEKALVGFYGKLAQGMTRDTFVSAEGTGLKPLDQFGRAMYLPPCVSGNAMYLSMLRSLLVQDRDLDHDGAPETLRLLFTTPKRWLENGKTIIVENAPTSFGDVSIKLTSRVNKGEVVIQVNLPERNPAKKTLLRARVPDGLRAVSAQLGKRKLPVDEQGTIDLSGLTGKQTIRFDVEKL